MALALGDCCTFVVNRAGALHSWGTNNHDQLGSFRNEQPVVPMAESTIPTPIREFGEHVKMVAAYRSNVACVMKDGSVFSWGNTNYQLNETEPAYKTGPPLHLGREEFQGEWATQVACSPMANFILTDKGSVFCSKTVTRRVDLYPPPPDMPPAALCSDHEGVLYYRQLEPTSLCPRECFSGMKISMIATGAFHVLAIGVVRGLWSWGHNQQGSLGRGSGTDLCTTVPLAVPVFDGHKMTYVAAGAGNSMAVSAGTCDERGTVVDAGLWVWGDGSYGQLGIGDFLEQPFPVRNQDPCFQHANITMVACGETSTGVLLETGALYMFGCTKEMTMNHWILRQKSYEADAAVNGLQRVLYVTFFDTFRPEKVNPDYFYGARIVSIAIGDKHMAAITENGHLYMWYGGKIPSLFHPIGAYNADDPAPFMHQPYFGSALETRQNRHRLDHSHLARYAAGQFRNVREHRRRERSDYS